MQGFKSVLSAGFLISFAWLSPITPVHADELKVSGPGIPQASFSVMRESVPNMQPVFRTYVTMGTNKFTFVVPNGFRVETTTTDKIVFVSTDYSCFLSVGIIGQVTPPTTEQPDSKPYRNLLVGRHDEVNIIEESSRNVADFTGPMFDLEWKNSAGGRQFARETFIPFADGVLEFSIITMQPKFSRFQHDYNSLLSTFRSGKNGQFDVAHLSNGSV